MESLSSMSSLQLKETYERFKKEYEDACNLNIKLDISRGKPNSDQLDISDGLLTCLTAADLEKYEIDYRNYGILEGAWEARELFSHFLGVTPEETYVMGNSSLNIMYDLIMRAMFFGTVEGNKPWSQQGNIKFLCPCPGYDRHFAITEQFGIEMINIPMTEAGPDMDLVEKLVQDESVKGMWCVPKYSNPQGITYSDETVVRLAKMKTAATDFRIFWDNAYCVHDFTDDGDKLLNIMEECKKYGTEDRPYILFSTSKVTFAGAGVAALGASLKNIEWAKKFATVQTISFDKINQIRHVKYFGSPEGIYRHMKKHAAILKPKFEKVLEVFDRELAPLGCVYYPRPKGGYFISLDVPNGCAKRCVELCKNAGVSLTPAGATYPYKKDPNDKNIRIAPSYIEVDDIEKACKVLCASVKLACIEKFVK